MIERIKSSYLLILCILMTAGLFYIYYPFVQIIRIRCPFKYLTGLYCPLCGSMRGIAELFKGNIAAAAGFNAPVIIGLLLAVCVLIFRALCYIFDKDARLPFSSPGFIKGFIILMIIYGIMRNIQ